MPEAEIIERLKAENEKLRAALYDLVECCTCEDCPDTRMRAHAALEHTKKTGIAIK